MMRDLRIGSLCSGYGGLELGIQSVIGGTTAWVSDIDKGACKVLAHRFPGIPNIGDMTAVDWTTVEPVDVICGGTPCQDLSHAGKRAGMTEGTRSNLWVSMREAIATIKPTLVVWENVGGAYSAAATSDLEQREGLLGDRPGRPALRALGRVLGDLASLGYDARWHGIRAADVGAPHGRLRVFVVSRKRHPFPWSEDALCAPADASLRAGHGQWSRSEPRQGGALLPSPRTSDTNGAGRHGDGGMDLRTAVSMLPTPRATDGTKGGPNQRGSSGDLMLPSAVAQLLPTPAVNDMGEGKTVEAWDAWTAKMKAAHGNGNGHGASLSIEAQRQSLDWGQYADAIHRWESLTRTAPAPTETGPKGSPRLSARFSEWMMGCPDGWITDVPGVTRNEALKLAGNGVVPQQAAAALREMFSWEAAA